MGGFEVYVYYIWFSFMGAVSSTSHLTPKADCVVMAEIHSHFRHRDMVDYQEVADYLYDLRAVDGHEGVKIAHTRRYQGYSWNNHMRAEARKIAKRIHYENTIPKWFKERVDHCLPEHLRE